MKSMGEVDFRAAVPTYWKALDVLMWELHAHAVLLSLYYSVCVWLDCRYFLLFMQNPTPTCGSCNWRTWAPDPPCHVDKPPLLPGEVDTELWFCCGLGHKAYVMSMSSIQWMYHLRIIAHVHGSTLLHLPSLAWSHGVRNSERFHCMHVLYYPTHMRKG